MSLAGTDAHTALPDLPPLVRAAPAAARARGFPHSCRPERGRLLHVLAGGARLRIAETGTGLGVGLAWLVSGAPAGVRLYSVERDPERARGAAEVFADRPEVTVLTGDDFTPAAGRPPLHEVRPDRARPHWLEHPALRAVELRLAADLSTVVGTRLLV